MSDIKVFMKVLDRVGYPNPKLVQIAQASSYNLDSFLLDLTSEIGLEKTQSFVSKSLKKFLGPKLTRKVDVTDENQGPSYIVYQIKDLDYDPEEAEDGVYCYTKVLDSQLMNDKGELETLQQIESGTDFSEWNDYHDYENSLWAAFNVEVYNNCGFWL